MQPWSIPSLLGVACVLSAALVGCGDARGPNETASMVVFAKDLVEPMMASGAPFTPMEERFLSVKFEDKAQLRVFKNSLDALTFGVQRVGASTVGAIPDDAVSPVASSGLVVTRVPAAVTELRDAPNGGWIVRFKFLEKRSGAEAVSLNGDRCINADATVILPNSQAREYQLRSIIVTPADLSACPGKSPDRA